MEDQASAGWMAEREALHGVLGELFVKDLRRAQEGLLEVMGLLGPYSGAADLREEVGRVLRLVDSRRRSEEAARA